jgi:hypothetical protein
VIDRSIIDDAFTFVGGLSALGCVTAIVITWMRRARAAVVPTADVLRRLDAIAEQVARVDGSIDAMAVEVERISEAQRFTARVLAERSAAPGAPDKPRSIGSSTPH